MKNLVKLATILLTFNTSALNFVDPQGVLGEVDDFIGHTSFNKAFVQNEYVSQSVSSCIVEEDGYACELDYADLEVIKTDEQISFINFSGGSDEGEFYYTAQTFNNKGGNYIKLLLNQGVGIAKNANESVAQKFNEEEPYEAEIVGSAFEVVEFNSESIVVKNVDLVLKWSGGFYANVNVKLFQNQTLLGSIYSYEFDMMGLANVSMTMQDYYR